MLVSNWYSKLRVSVRWKCAVSASFRVYNGVRQGSTLSPSLLSVFINVLIVRLSHLGLNWLSGWLSVCWMHFLLYADDIILLSASVFGLKCTLKCCYDVNCEL